MIESRSGRVIVSLLASMWLAACERERPSAAPPADPLLGAWCQQSEAAAADGPRVPTGAKWELRSDGTYRYAFKWHRWDEPWSRAGTTLKLGRLGEHQIVELKPDAMVLSQGATHKYFGRDCGPEYAKAELVHELVGAAEKAAPAQVEAALGRGAAIDGIDRLGVLEQTALIAAVRAHDLAMVKLLLSRGARHDIETSQGVTAMNAAELAGYLDIVEALREAGAHPSARPAPPRPLTAEEVEAARVQRLLDLDPGALIEHAAPARVPAPAPAPAASPAVSPLVAAAPVASATASAPALSVPKPPKDPPKSEQEKQLESLKKELCDKRPPNLDAPPTAELAELLKALGMSPAEYAAQQRAIYDDACQ